MVGLGTGIWSNQGLGLGFGTQINKIIEKRKPKDVVWDALRTAMKPEKKLRTAETDICLSVMSNNGFGDWNLVKLRIGV